MIAYLVRRVLLAAAVVVVVSFASFCTFGVSLDPAFQLLMSPDHTNYRIVVAHYHLHDPILYRYWLWVENFFHHGFGRPVSTAVASLNPPTVDRRRGSRRRCCTRCGCRCSSSARR